MAEPFVPDEVVDLPTVDELMDDSPIDEDAVDEAGEAWIDEPPDEEFDQILDAEQEEEE